MIITYSPKVASVLIFDRFTAFGLSAAVPAAVLLLLVALTVFAVQSSNPGFAGGP